MATYNPPSSGSGAAQLPTWTFLTGGGTPTAGKFTTDNNTVSATTTIVVHKTDGAGVDTDDLLGYLYASTRQILILTDTAGVSAYFDIEAITDATSCWSLQVASIGATGTWSGAYTVSYAVKQVLHIDGGGITGVINPPQVVGVTLSEKHTASDYTIGTTDPNELYGGIIYVEGACVLSVPAVVVKGSFTVKTEAAVVTSVDPDNADLIRRDGVAQADGEKVTSTGAAGDLAVFTYYDGTGWSCSSNGWTNGG